MFFYRLSVYFSRRRAVPALCFAVALAVLALAAVSFVNARLDSALAGYVDVTLEGIISSAVNGAVLEELQTGEYDGLIKISRDRDGRISSVETDAPRVSVLKARVAQRTLEKLQGPETREVSVPLGTLTGGRLLAGRGPRVTVKMMAMGSANTAVASEFTSAGINQTLHRMILEISVSITVVTPGSTVVHTREKQVVLGETVIVGTVPESYTYIDDTRDSPLDKILDHSGG